MGEVRERLGASAAYAINPGGEVSVLLLIMHDEFMVCLLESSPTANETGRRHLAVSGRGAAGGGQNREGVETKKSIDLAASKCQTAHTGLRERLPRTKERRRANFGTRRRSHYIPTGVQLYTIIYAYLPTCVKPTLVNLPSPIDSEAEWSEVREVAPPSA